MLKKLPVIVQISLISIVFFLIHFGIATFLNRIHATLFLTSYALEFVMTLVILITLIKIQETAEQQLGFVFLGLSTLKVGISYYFATEYLFQNTGMLETNKINFFVLFMFFLCLDVYFAIKILNKKP